MCKQTIFRVSLHEKLYESHKKCVAQPDSFMYEKSSNMELSRLFSSKIRVSAHIFCDLA